MASEHATPNVPHVDDAMRTEQIAELAARIAVPNFDWVGQPIEAVVDGLTAHGGTAEPDSGPGAAESPGT
jgi:hypothetical protein